MSEVLDRIVTTREAAHVAARKREYNRARYAAKREQVKAQVAAYRAANSDKVRTGNLSYAQRNAEKISRYQAEYRAAHREQACIVASEWRKANPVRAKAAVDAWYAAHPDAMRIKKQNRRALKKGSGGRLSSGLVDFLMAMQKGKCAGCRGSLKALGLHLDHIFALSKGGEHADRNMQLLCPPCNMAKSDLSPDVWARRLGRLL